MILLDADILLLDIRYPRDARFGANELRWAIALFVWRKRLVGVTFPLTLSLSHKGRGDPRALSSGKCKPL
jgi:hypothetical protein